MSGYQSLNVTEIGTVNVGKMKPNWLRLAIGLSVAILLHTVFFCGLSLTLVSSPSSFHRCVTVLPFPREDESHVEDESNMIIRINTRHFQIVDVSKVAFPSQIPGTLGSIVFPEPEEDLDELIGWFGLSMSFIR